MNPQFQRALFLKAAGRPSEAVQELRACLAREPEQAFLWATLASFLNELERRQEALQAARESVRLDPVDPYGHYILAAIQVDRDESAAAAQSAREAIRLAPEDADNHALLARILMADARWDEALAAADAGLALDPGNTASLFNRASILAKLGRHEASRATLATLSRLHPDHAISHHAHGYALIEQGHFAAACHHFLEALRVDPSDDDARRGLVLCLRARHSLYGLAVRALLWLGRFRAAQRWLIWLGMAGVLFLALLLERLHPDWAPALVVVKAAWWCIALSAVLAGPLFTLAIRCDPDGRRALSPDEIRASNWHIPCIAAAALFGLCSAYSGFLWFGWALAMLSLVTLVDEHFDSRSPWVRRRLRLAAWVVLAALPLSLLALAVGVSLRPPLGRPFLVAGPILPVLASIAGFYADNLRVRLEQRRPDDIPSGSR